MRILTSLVLLLVACGKSSQGGGSETETLPLGKSGFVIDVPKGWTIEAPMSGFYELKGGHGHPLIADAPRPAGTLDDAVKATCEGQSEIKKETLPGGGVFVSCKGPGKIVEGHTTTKVSVHVPKDDHSSFDCSLETDADPAIAVAICKSIRKK